MKTIAILGMGEMGSRVALNLRKSGFEIRVWNRNYERCKPLVEQGATQYDSPKAAVLNADIIISMLTDDTASRDVWLNETNGAIFALKKDTVVIESSTLSLSWCLELATHVKKHHANFLDAPVLGSRPQADAAQLIYLVGGDEQILNQVKEVLVVNSSAIHYIGETGTGMSMKLAINGLFGMQVSALAEMIGMLEKSGITKDAALTVINQLPTTSPALKGIGLAIAANNYAPLFPIDLVKKDFGYLQSLSNSCSAEIPLTNTTKVIFQKAIKSGYGSNNIAAVARLYSE